MKTHETITPAEDRGAHASYIAAQALSHYDGYIIGLGWAGKPDFVVADTSANRDLKFVTVRAQGGTVSAERELRRAAKEWIRQNPAMTRGRKYTIEAVSLSSAGELVVEQVGSQR